MHPMEVIRRKSARAILLTPEREVLLIKIDNATNGWVGWITPGGGIEAGESEDEGLRRELWEELGLRDFTIEGKVWERYHEFPWKEKIVAQAEVYFLVRIERFDAEPKVPMEASEMLDLKEMRWWKLEELKSSAEVFAPRAFVKELMILLEQGICDPPKDVGI